jgi:orotate phosphoribosyltransferase
MADYRGDVVAFAMACEVLRFGSFVTKAGRISPDFLNAGLFDHGDTCAGWAEFYATALLASGLACDQLFGPAYKGITLAAATAVALAEKGHNLPYSFNRKEAKDHGEGTVGDRARTGDARRMHAALAGAAALVVALTAGAGHAAALYKWVDEKGVVHYTDKLPADAVERGTVELNKQGIPIKRTDAAPTAEQRRGKELEEERQKQLAREREVVDRRDRALMESYTSADEIELARNRALDTLEAQLRSAQVYSVTLGKRRQELETRRKSSGDNAVPAVERELEGIAKELGRQEALIAERKRQINAVSARYDADKQRWQELRAIAVAKESAAAAAGTSSPPTPSRSTAGPPGGSPVSPATHPAAARSNAR